MNSSRLLTVLAAALTLAASAPRPASAAAPPPPPLAEAPVLPVLFPVPRFAFIDQDGHPFTTRALNGKVWIADFIYTTCTTACPVLSAKMKLLQRKLEGTGVEFVSFSVDPAHDRPAALKAYAAKWHADETRWRLLDTRSEAALHKLVEGLQTDFTARASPDAPIMHSESFLLIDTCAQVRGRYDSTSPDDLHQLVRDAAALAGHAPTAAPMAAAPGGDPVAVGRELFASVGCMACHAQPQVAPQLEGVAGSTVSLGTGRTTLADAAYLRSSIVDPMRDVVAGYLGSMPSYRGSLSGAQVDALVAYLVSIGKGKAQAAPASARIPAVDPVCGMKLSAAADSPHARFRGKIYYFCSDTCRAQFEKSPAHFARAQAHP